MLANGVISLCDGRRTDVRDVTRIWAHSVTGISVSHRYGNTGIDTNIILLSAGEKIHHSYPKYIHVRLLPGDLAENDEESMRVFVEHFSKVINNHRKTDKNVINDRILREVMTEPDKVPTWE